jgi:hypothetical protein
MANTSNLLKYIKYTLRIIKVPLIDTKEIVKIIEEES